ncbi:MAG: hypothetical protein ACKOPM_01235 [Novosphingobium sp.]
MARQTIIVPSASAVVLFGLLAITSMMRSCGLAPQQHQSASAANGGLIKDYVAQGEVKPKPAQSAPSEQAP